jgi:hypothetical protein
MNTKTLGTLLVSLSISVSCVAFTACGGDKSGPKSPESNSGITETSAKEDMPPPPAKSADTAASPTDAKAEGQGAAGGMLKLSAMKVTTTRPAKDKNSPKPVELKADGSILVDGKPAAKVKGDQVDSTEGTSMVTIGVSGGLVGNGVKSGFRFEGDDLVTDDGLKVTVGEDGTISATKDGKTESFAKAEGGAGAKRTALVLAALWMNIPTAPQGDKASAKPTATKPATKK